MNYIFCSQDCSSKIKELDKTISDKIKELRYAEYNLPFSWIRYLEKYLFCVSLLLFIVLAIALIGVPAPDTCQAILRGIVFLVWLVAIIGMPYTLLQYRKNKVLETVSEKLCSMEDQLCNISENLHIDELTELSELSDFLRISRQMDPDGFSLFAEEHGKTYFLVAKRFGKTYSSSDKKVTVQKEDKVLQIEVRKEIIPKLFPEKDTVDFSWLDQAKPHYEEILVQINREFTLPPIRDCEDAKRLLELPDKSV